MFHFSLYGFIMLEKPIIEMLLFFKIVRAALFSGTTRVFYDRISRIYDNVFTYHKIHIEKIVDLLTSIYSKRNYTVIDLGCGTGMLSKAISDIGFYVVGVDISFGSLRVLKKVDSRVALIQGDAESLAFKDHSLQALVCLGAWRHFKHLEVIINEIERVLTKDGHFVIGYFPPKLGGLFHITENSWGRILANVYNNVVRRFGYEDIAGSELERKTMQALSKKFENVHKVDSGEHWHLVMVSGPRTTPNWM